MSNDEGSRATPQDLQCPVCGWVMYEKNERSPGGGSGFEESEKARSYFEAFPGERPLATDAEINAGALRTITREDAHWIIHRWSQEHPVTLKDKAILEKLEMMAVHGSTPCSAELATSEYTGYAVVMDDPNSAPEGFWWVGAWHHKETADDIAKKHGAAAHVVPITSKPSSATRRIGDRRIGPDTRRLLPDRRVTPSKGSDPIRRMFCRRAEGPGLRSSDRTVDRG